MDIIDKKTLRRLIVASASMLFMCDLFANITIGSFGPLISRVRDEAESTESALSIKPYIGVFYKYRLSAELVLDFEFDYVFPQDSYDGIQEPTTQSKRYIWSANSNYYFNPKLYGVLGLSTVVTKVTGDGGTVNVSGTDYYVPTEPENSSHNLVFNFGVGFNFTEKIYGELKTHLWRPLDSEARGVSISFALKSRFF